MVVLNTAHSLYSLHVVILISIIISLHNLLLFLHFHALISSYIRHSFFSGYNCQYVSVSFCYFTTFYDLWLPHSTQSKLWHNEVMPLCSTQQFKHLHLSCLCLLNAHLPLCLFVPRTLISVIMFHSKHNLKFEAANVTRLKKRWPKKCTAISKCHSKMTAATLKVNSL